MQPPQGRDLLFPGLDWEIQLAGRGLAHWGLRLVGDSCFFFLLDVTSRLTGLTSDCSKPAE
jgi:hypothetical protein